MSIDYADDCQREWDRLNKGFLNTTSYVITHNFVSKHGDDRICGKCGKYWKHYNHHRAFDKSKEGDEALFFDEFIQNELEFHIKKYSNKQAE